MKTRLAILCLLILVAFFITNLPLVSAQVISVTPDKDCYSGIEKIIFRGKVKVGNSKKEESKKIESKKEEKVSAPSSQSKKVETTKTSDVTNIGNLVLPDGSKIEIDKSQRLVGRVDLAQFSDDDSENISRGHFTVFEDSGTYYIQDGSTNVQEKPSKNHTFKNEEDITDKGRVQLSDDDIIKVSTVEINFKLE